MTASGLLKVHTGEKGAFPASRWLARASSIRLTPKRSSEWACLTHAHKQQPPHLQDSGAHPQSFSLAWESKGGCFPNNHRAGESTSVTIPGDRLSSRASYYLIFFLIFRLPSLKDKHPCRGGRQGEGGGELALEGHQGSESITNEPSFTWVSFRETLLNTRQHFHSWKITTKSWCTAKSNRCSCVSSTDNSTYMWGWQNWAQCRTQQQKATLAGIPRERQHAVLWQFGTRALGPRTWDLKPKREDSVSNIFKDEFQNVGGGGNWLLSNTVLE